MDEKMGASMFVLQSTSPGHMGNSPQRGSGKETASSSWSDTCNSSRGPHSSRSISASGQEWTARSTMTPEERIRERERLQDMVKEFAKAVVMGQPCQWLCSNVGSPRPATYAFDKALSTFTLRPEESQPLTVQMMRIREVSKDLRETPFIELLDLPRPHALAGDELERRFVCLVHEDPSCPGAKQHLGLLLPNPYERERFYKCMKILRWAMDTKRERG